MKKFTFLVFFSVILLSVPIVFSATTEITIEYGDSPSLDVSIVGSPTSPIAESTSYDFSSRVTNVGTADGTSVTLTWALPTDWTITSGNLVVNLGTLSPNALGWNNISITTGSVTGDHDVNSTSDSTEGFGETASVTLNIPAPAGSPPPSGNGGSTGGGGGGGGIAPPVVTTIQPPEDTAPVEQAIIDYNIPGELTAFLNETFTVPIELKNPTNLVLHNVSLEVSGLPAGSYTILTTSLDELFFFRSATFFVEINTFDILADQYDIIWIMNSDEVVETAGTVLTILPSTRLQAQEQEFESALQEAEEFRLGALSFVRSIIFVLLVGFGAAGGLMLYYHARNRCALCGGKIKKVYEGKNITESKCTKCGEKYISKKIKKIKGEKVK